MTVDDTDGTTADERPGRGAFMTRTRRLFLAWGVASTAMPSGHASNTPAAVVAPAARVRTEQVAESRGPASR